MVIYSQRGLHGQASELLGRRIVTGAIPEHATLNTDKLGEEMNVSRTVVREMLRSLATKGLVDARPRIGTYVLPRSKWNLLDADIMRWRGEGEPSPRLLEDLDELRRLVEPWGARQAAIRRSEADLTEMKTQLDLIGVRSDTETGAEHGSHIDADVAFHSAILHATGNELAQRLIVVLEPLLRFRDSLIAQDAQSATFVDAHLEVYEAIANQDPDGAERATLALLDQAAVDISKIIKE